MVSFSVRPADVCVRLKFSVHPPTALVQLGAGELYYRNKQCIKTFNIYSQFRKLSFSPIAETLSGQKFFVFWFLFYLFIYLFFSKFTTRGWGTLFPRAEVQAFTFALKNIFKDEEWTVKTIADFVMC